MKNFAVPRLHLFAVVFLVVCGICGFLLLKTEPLPQQKQNTISSVSDGSAKQAGEAAPAKQDDDQQRYQVKKGDTLSGIFSDQGFAAATLRAVLAADEGPLALDVLRPGDVLRFERDVATGELVTLSFSDLPGHTLFYRRVSAKHFEFDEQVAPSHWVTKVISGPIRGNFYLSARNAGMTDSDISRFQHIFSEQINFRRDLHAGDWFELVLQRELIEDGPTGRSRIEAAQMRLGDHTQSAFLFSDGRYYDESGHGLGRAFLRYPMAGHYRVSSPFNLHRIHPVTGRVSPHYGVDFAMPSGTPILSIGDGVVTRIGNHPYAGKYIEITYPGELSTRYLHLSHIDVRHGEKVQRGQRIALSGNTGRTTGPHLHFELHVNNRAVDPLKADLPVATQVPEKQMPVFKQTVSDLVAMMHKSDSSLTAQSGNQDAVKQI